MDHRRFLWLPVYDLLLVVCVSSSRNDCYPVFTCPSERRTGRKVLFCIICAYDYTLAKDFANDLDYSPEQYEDFELLDPEDFLKP